MAYAYTESDVTVTDMFCGAGGSSTGAVWAGATVKVAMNHWNVAINTHNANHPNTDHILTDIVRVDPWYIPSTRILIASPECTNHTLAKGKKRKNLTKEDLWGKNPNYDPAEERSRCTMWDPLRFAEHHRYDAVILENVVDARQWAMWRSWLSAWDELGYETQVVYFNSMFAHPTPQSRDRMYVVCWKKGIRRKPDLDIRPPAWCTLCEKNVDAVQSWKNILKQHGKYGKKRGQYVYRCLECANVVTPYYYCAANAIDWSLPITRIGDRKKPLEPKTMARIQTGIDRYSRAEYAEETVFLLSTLHGSNPSYTYQMEQPYPTQTGTQDMALVRAPYTFLFSLNHAQAKYTDMLNEPGSTQTSYDATGMCLPPFLVNHLHAYRPGTLTDPMNTVCGMHHQSMVVPPFLIDHVAEYRTRSLTSPVSTVVGGGNHTSIFVPSWIMTYYQNGAMVPIQDTSPTITTLERHALVTASLPQGGAAQTPITIEDCYFRMLEPTEIQRAMAFPDEYIVTGTRRDKVKQLGNAVTPPVMQLLMERVLAIL